MKRIFLLVLMLSCSLALYSEIQIGPTGFYNFKITNPGDVPGFDTLGLEDFVFGLDGRLTLAILQVSGLLLYHPGFYDVDNPELSSPGSMELYADGGLAFDMAMFRITAAGGLNFALFIGDNVSDAVNFGTNLKIGGEVKIGGLSIGLNYLMYVDLTHPDGMFTDVSGLLGVSILLNMFS